MNTSTRNLLIGGGVVGAVVVAALAMQFSGTLFKGQLAPCDEPAVTFTPNALSFTMQAQQSSAAVEMTAPQTPCDGATFDQQIFTLIDDENNNEVKSWQGQSELGKSGFVNVTPDPTTATKKTFTFNVGTPINGYVLGIGTYTFVSYNGMNGNALGKMTLDVKESNLCQGLQPMAFTRNGTENDSDDNVLPVPKSSSNVEFNVDRNFPPAKCLKGVGYKVSDPDDVAAQFPSDFVTLDGNKKIVGLNFSDPALQEFSKQGRYIVEFFNQTDNNSFLGNIYIAACRDLKPWAITQNGEAVNQNNPIEVNEGNFNSPAIVSISSIETGICGDIDPKLTDPDNLDRTNEVSFDTDEPNSFVGATPTNDPNVMSVSFYFYRYPEVFSKDGMYALSLLNKLDDNAVLATIYFNNTVPVAEPAAAPAPAPAPAPIVVTPPEPAPIEVIIEAPEPIVVTEPAPAPAPAPSEEQQPTPAAVTCGGFNDASTFSSFVCDIAARAKEAGIFTSASFRPNDSVKRFEAALTIVRALDIPEACVSNVLDVYIDIDKQAEYFNELCTGVTVKVITGYEADPQNPILLPARQVTFREFARMLMNGYRIIGRAGLPRNYSEVAVALGFSQEPNNDWFGFSLQFMVNEGIVSLAELRNTNLDKDMTRLEVAELLLRTMQ